MAKLTRKSYKRKKIAFAAILLGGVALVSSGFAAWVLSAGADQKNNGNIEAGTVVNGALKMEVFSMGSDGEKTGEAISNGSQLNEYFSFNCDSKDVKGLTENGGNGEKDGKISNRMYWKENQDKAEQLSNGFVIVITSTEDSLSEFNIKMETSNDKDFDKPTTAGFITKPGCYSDTGVSIIGTGTNDIKWTEGEQKSGNDTYTVVKTGNASEGFTWTIKYKVAFGWGDRFNNVNPCYFFDNQATSKVESSKAVVRTGNTDDTIGNCYGESAINLYQGWDTANITAKMIEDDMKWFHDKVDKASYTLTFTATGL